ncbi:hypothetical protein [Bacillus sp. JJ722]|uniref:hypothetical protein n=1 Tax=Bacillus sp. JJ722 TaxID=3122973 RepID=UPI002FFD637A
MFGFNILSDVLETSNKTGKLIVLSDALFEKDAPDEDQFNLEVKNVKKLITSYPIWNLDIIDNNHLVYTTLNPANIGVTKVNTININDQTTFGIDENNTAKGLVVSSDGTQLLYSVVNSKNSSSVVFLYDLENKKVKAEYTGTALQFLPEKDAFLGFDENQLFVQNLNTQSRKIISSVNLKYKTMIGKIKVSSFNTSLAHDRAFIVEFDQNKSFINMINLKKDRMEKVVEADIIQDFTVFNESSLLIQGVVNGQEGLFSYSLNDKKFKLIVEGQINTFNITADGRLAYSLMKNDGVSELYVAYYHDDEIQHMKQVYMESNNVIFLKWNKYGNMLFYASGGGEGTNIIRFTF